MNKTSIEWTTFSANPLKYRDASGKVVWGCVHASPGCVNCYSEATAKRWDKGGPFNVQTMKGLTPFLDDAELHHMLTAKVIEKTPVSGSRCFVGDMTDIFGEWVPDELLDRLFAVFALRSDVTWQVLTKRAQRMHDYFADKDRVTKIEEQLWEMHADDTTNAMPIGPLKNVWLGVSVENQKYADERIPLLLATRAAVRFISAEPLLGPVDLGLTSATCKCCTHFPSRWVRVYRPIVADFPLCLLEQNRGRSIQPGVHRAESNLHGALSVNGLGLRPCDFDALPSLDLVIAGGESSRKARPFDVAWGRSILAQCKAAGIAGFMKQLGSNPEIAQGCGDCDPCLAGQRCYQSYNVRMELKDSKGGKPVEWPADLRVRQFPAGSEMWAQSAEERQ